MKKEYIIGMLVGIFCLVGLTFFLKSKETAELNAPGPLDQFAQCLKEKGAVFYGAFWCPHCQNQKKMFGNSKRLLPYEECSTADTQGRLQVCIDKGVETYPTWIFADGTRKTGEISLAELANQTGCVLPQ